MAELDKVVFHMQGTYSYSKDLGKDKLFAPEIVIDTTHFKKPKKTNKRKYSSNKTIRPK